MSDIKSITYEGASAVTASDTVNDPRGPFAAVFTGAGGTIKLTTLRNEAVTFVSLPAGVILPVATLRVWASGTTATGVLGMIALPYKGPGPS
jgi:hypothetical protein